MTRLVVLGDCHFHAWQSHSKTLPNGRNSRFQDGLTALEEVKDFCERNEVETLVQVGDVFHTGRTKVPAAVYSDTWNAWRVLRGVVDRMYILVGNHDQHGRNATQNCLEPFKAFAEVVDRPLVERNDDLVLAFHPFTENIEELYRFLETMPAVDYFFGHQGISEAQLGAFQPQIKAEIDLGRLPLEKAHRWFWGHYHYPSDVTEKVHYAGSIMQLDQGERNEDKSFIYLDTEAGSFERIPLDNAPRFHQFDSLEEYKRQKEGGWVLEKDFVRLRVSSEVSEKVRREVPTDVEVEVQTQSAEEERIPLEAADDDKQILERYVEEQETTLEEDSLVRSGMEYLSG